MLKKFLVIALCLFALPVYAGHDNHKHHDDHDYKNIFSSDDPAVVRKLIEERGLSVKARYDDNETLLIKAIDRRANSKVISELINMGSDLNAQDEDGDTALIRAVDKRYDYNVIKILLDAGSNVNIQGEDGETALMKAIDENATEEIINLLLDSGADVNIRDRKGRSSVDYISRESLYRNSDTLKRIQSLAK